MKLEDRPTKILQTAILEANTYTITHIMPDRQNNKIKPPSSRITCKPYSTIRLHKQYSLDAQFPAGLRRPEMTPTTFEQQH